MIVRPVEPGARIHSIRLENPGAPEPDGDGGYTQTWVALNPATAMAQIETASTQRLERIGYATVTSNATSIVSLPYHAGVTTKTRLLFGARVLHVIGVVNPLEQNVNTIAVCSEVVD